MCQSSIISPNWVWVCVCVVCEGGGVGRREAGLTGLGYVHVIRYPSQQVENFVKLGNYAPILIVCVHIPATPRLCH